MIVHLRGGNGAGKSFAARAIMNRFMIADPKKIFYSEELADDFSQFVRAEFRRRRSSIGTLCSSSDSVNLFVPGHYEIANGGVDTLQSVDSMIELLKYAQRRCWDVVCEGKNGQDLTIINRLMENFSRECLIFVRLDVDEDECVRSVRARGHSISESSIRSLHRRITARDSHIQAHGYKTMIVDRAHIVDVVHDTIMEQYK
jgi:thymidylate kinase